MSLGLGQLFGGLLLGQMAGGLLGGKQEEEQPTQVASNNQSLMGGLQGISNSMFKGMSQEEVYRMGLGFNTLRLEPDQNLAASYESRLKNAREQESASAQKNQTIQYLANMKSEAYPNGRLDLIELVNANLIPPLEALAEAREPKSENESAIAEQLRLLRDPDVSDYEYAVLYPSQSESDFQTKLALIDQATDPETGELNLSDGRMQLFGITDPALFKQKTAELAQMYEDGTITKEAFEQGKYKILTDLAPDRGKKAGRFEMLHQVATQVNGFAEGSTEYKEYINANIDGAAIAEINLNNNEDAASAYLQAYLPEYIKESSAIVKEVDIAVNQLGKLGDLMDILEADESGQGVAPYTGIFQPLLTEASRMVTSLGIDRKYASEIEAYKNAKGETEKAKARDILYEKLVKTEITKVMTGSDVFPMISSLGIGARGLDTPAERDFLISVMTGLPNMTIDTLKYMTKFRIQMYIDGLEKYNQKVKSGYFKMHNNNKQLMPREVIDLEPLYRYTETGEKIERDSSGERVITYTQEERDIIMKGLGGL